MGRAAGAGIGLVVAGVAGIVAAVVADLGRWPYWGGALLLVIGVGLLLRRLLHRPLTLTAGCAAVALLVGGGAWLALEGLPDQHDTWPERYGGYGFTGDVGRLGDTWFTGPVAFDTATGQVRWTTWGDGEEPSSADDIHLVALTDTAVVNIEPAGREEWRLVARDPSDGGEQWSVPSERARGIAVDGDVLVLSSSTGTRSHDLRTGKQLWSSPTPAAEGCELTRLRQPYGPPHEQPVVVAMDEEAPGATADLVRVSDGKVLSSHVKCLNAARVVGDVVVHADGAHLAALSVMDGHEVWRLDEDIRPSAWALVGSGRTVFVPDSGGSVIDRYDAIDTATGEVSETSPPEGWEIGRYATRRQHGEHAWQVVLRLDGDTGLWELGTDHILPVSGSRPLLEGDPSGWLVFTSRVEDLVGDRQPTAWALSPTGELYGPFAGRDAYVAPGLLQLDDRVIPLD